MQESSLTDYEPVLRPRPQRATGDTVSDDGSFTSQWPGGETGEFEAEEGPARPAAAIASVRRARKEESWTVRRGHTLSYLGVFLFTIILYFRPYELFPGLSWLSTSAFWVGLTTLVIFVPSQVFADGVLSARPREVSLILLFAACALISIPLASNPGDAWSSFTDPFIKAVAMMIVMINVVRTEGRLKGLFFLSLAVSCLLSVVGINDYRTGNTPVDGERIRGFIGNLFGNPNDMGIHLVTMVPIAVALFLSSTNLLKKLLYGACAFVIMGGVVATFSRGGFLALIGVAVVMIWKLGRKNRLAVTVVGSVVLALFIGLAPGNYGVRIVSIFVPSLDPVGSSTARKEHLKASFRVALNNPLFGVGMGNTQIVGIHNTVSHNAYTQVAAELGLPALMFYLMFMITPLRRLRLIEREQFAKEGKPSRFYYLAVGLQASLIGYMISSFFASVAYQWYVYYLVAYAVCLRRIYQSYVEGSPLQTREPTIPKANEDGRRKEWLAAESPSSV